MLRITRKRVWLAVLAVVLVGALVAFWQLWLSPTRIAFINYQPIALQGISAANSNPMIKLYAVSEKEVSRKRLRRYDIIIVNGMGLRIDAEQRAALEALAASGVPIYTSMATNPENAITNMDGEESMLLTQWMMVGGETNYRSLLSFMRHNIDGKIIYTGEALPPTSADDVGIQRFELGDGSTGAPRILVTGMITDPMPLVDALVAEKRYDVYLAQSTMGILATMDELRPDAVVNLAHGRIGDEFVDYCREHNVLYFDPLTINDEVSTWQNDRMGMSGGFLSQSVVTPEIDGAIRTSVVFAQEKGRDGMLHAIAIPERLDTYVQTINHYFDLRTKPNSEKRVAIVYFKGWGEKPLVASGLDVKPSLDNFVERLVSEGYRRENIVLRMQPLAGKGEDVLKITHGVDQDPPQDYIDCYDWIRNEFKADAIVHFGTHGSLEFTPHKQVALSSNDWPDRLIGALPHFYLYTIDNVGEAMTAKRRSYAQIISHLTAPYHASEMPKEYAALQEELKKEAREGETIKTLAMALGIHRDLALDTLRAWGDEEIAAVDDYAGEIMGEKVNGDTPYTLGKPYAAEDVRSSVMAMSVDPIAYSRYNIDRLLGRTTIEIAKERSRFEQTYIKDAQVLAERLYNGAAVSDEMICQLVGVSNEQLTEARATIAEQNAPKGMAAMMAKIAAKTEGNDTTSSGGGMAAMMAKMSANAGEIPQAKNGAIAKLMRHMKRKMLAKKDPTMMLQMAKRMGAPEEALKKMEAALVEQMGKPEETKSAEEIAAEQEQEQERQQQQRLALATALEQLETTLNNVTRYRALLTNSGTNELDALVAALNGAYTAPSPGGDPIANPNTLPTGRNLFAVNAEATPTADAWEKGVGVAKATLDDYRKKHHGEWPKKVSFTLWSGEFIQTGGATIAQALYMLGVEPVRDRYGRVTDLRLIDANELGRPRIDIVVQTSGQLRDLAASRLFLLSKAVQMAAEADAEEYDNFVREGVDDSERYLVDRGVAPKRARQLAQRRVFGGLNGGYGSGIQAMVNDGAAWRDESEIAETYIHNMGAFYGDEDAWEDYAQDAFAAALTNTDVVIQPRQNNSWGALSLDHVYEFMGGLNLAVRNVTGNDPDAYFADYRNRNHYKAQDAKAAIGVEARTKMLNESYIRKSLKNGANPSDQLAEMVRNTYGWNVMKPAAIDSEMWQEIYDVYVDDRYDLDIATQLKSVNPTALDEIAATMLESADRGFWQPTAEQRAKIRSTQAQAQAVLHSDATDNSADQNAIKMEKQSVSLGDEGASLSLSAIAIGVVVVVLLVVAVAMMRKRRG